MSTAILASEWLPTCLDGTALIGALQEADAFGSRSVEQHGGGKHDVGMNLEGPGGGQPQRLLSRIAGQVHLDGHRLAANQLVQPANLVDHFLQPCQDHVEIVGPASGDAHRRGRGLSARCGGCLVRQTHQGGPGHGTGQEGTAVDGMVHRILHVKPAGGQHPVLPGAPFLPGLSYAAVLDRARFQPPPAPRF
jgi:hypothetical protein